MISLHVDYNNLIGCLSQILRGALESNHLVKSNIAIHFCSVLRFLCSFGKPRAFTDFLLSLGFTHYKFAVLLRILALLKVSEALSLLITIITSDTLLRSVSENIFFYKLKFSRPYTKQRLI